MKFNVPLPDTCKASAAVGFSTDTNGKPVITGQQVVTDTTNGASSSVGSPFNVELTDEQEAGLEAVINDYLTPIVQAQLTPAPASTSVEA